jgi:hypothetical protein
LTVKEQEFWKKYRSKSQNPETEHRVKTETEGKQMTKTIDDDKTSKIKEITRDSSLHDQQITNQITVNG